MVAAAVRLPAGGIAGTLASTVSGRLDAIMRLDDATLGHNAESFARELLATGEAVLEAWLTAQGRAVEVEPAEGFRLLGLHRAGARGDPSFNACRETCRELVYRTNLAQAGRGQAGGDEKDVARELRLATMVARHLLLFIDGKLETAGLGEFCCSSRQLRTGDAAPAAPAETVNGS